jgi:hypothetical protein
MLLYLYVFDPRQLCRNVLWSRTIRDMFFSAVCYDLSLEVFDSLVGKIAVYWGHEQKKKKLLLSLHTLGNAEINNIYTY